MILIVTSFFPYEYKENWISEELKELSHNGNFCVLARSVSNERTHKLPNNVNEIKENIFSLEGLFLTIKKIRIIPSLTNIIYSHSINFFDFLKRLVLIPKALVCSSRARKMGVTHVHVHTTSSPATLGLIIAKQLGVKFSFTVHTSSQLNKKYFKNYKGLISQSSFVRTISERTKKNLLEFITGNYSIHNVRMGVKVDEITKNFIERSYLEPRFLMVSALEAYKGIEHSIIAMKSLICEFPKITLEIFGEGREEKFLKNLVNKNNLSNVVKFKGVLRHSDLQKLMANPTLYNFLLLSSDKSATGQEEGIPVAVMEAMSNGLIPIAVNNGDIKELLNDSCGVIVDKASPENLVVKIKEILKESTEKKIEMALKAKKVIQTKFDAKKNAKLLNKYFCK
tara:strand:+ start:6550 stop:7737 length:1188 start_codon:yes stop_codon:yes gene_type:complete